MKHLSIDIETRSSVDIGKAGLYKYAQSPDFRILLFAFQEDGNPVEVVDLAQGEEIPEHAVRMLADPDVTKHAYNAAFEWYCLNRAGYRTPLEQWRCTMAHGLYCGYTAGLDATGKAIGLPQDKQKLASGISVSPAGQQRPTGTVPGTSRGMQKRNGSFSRNTTDRML